MKEKTGVILGYKCHNSTSSYDAVILIKVFSPKQIPKVGEVREEGSTKGKKNENLRDT